MEGAVDSATEAAGEAADAVTEAASDAASDAAGAVADIFDPANFDADSVNAAIDGSSLDDAMKTTLKATVDAAKDSPELLGAALDQVKAALGL